MTDPRDTGGLDVTFVLGEGVTAADRDRAEQVIRHVAGKASRPVIFARVKIRVDETRPPDEQAIAQGTLDMSGVVMRGQVAAPTMAEAVGALASRLERQMRKVAERREDAAQRPGSTPEGQWRSGDLPTDRPSYFPRPDHERSIVRRKTFAPGSSSIEEAMFAREVLDHRFYLFTDDGVDSIVYETPEGVALRTLTGELPADPAPPVEVDTTPVPSLTEAEAAGRLDVSNAPFIFFRSQETDRGAVLYRRYDGDYGLIEPSV